MAEMVLKIFRGTREGGRPAEYRVPVAPGMVVLDALHYVQRHQAPDLAVRWNCKAGKWRIVLGRGERPASTDVQDPHGRVAAGPARYHFVYEVVPGDQRSGDRRLLELQSE